jgi:glycerol-3-phosphate acyltransferase PlsY
MILSIACAYLIGAIPTSYIITKRVKGIDIRTLGSKNAGATNVVRSVGKAAGILVFIIDFLKGVAAIALARALSGGEAYSAMLVGLAAIIGHIYPVYIGFKGGKGVATALGVIAAVNLILFFITVAAWLVTAYICKIVSVSSIAAIWITAAASYFLLDDKRAVAAFVALATLVTFTHRSNIARLFSGKEYKINT